MRLEMMTVLDLAVMTTLTVAVESVRATKTTVDVLNIVIVKTLIGTSEAMKMTGILIVAVMMTLATVANDQVQNPGIAEERTRENEPDTTVKTVQVHGEDTNHSLFLPCIDFSSFYSFFRPYVFFSADKYTQLTFYLK